MCCVTVTLWKTVTKIIVSLCNELLTLFPVKWLLQTWELGLRALQSGFEVHRDNDKMALRGDVTPFVVKLALP